MSAVTGAGANAGARAGMSAGTRARMNAVPPPRPWADRIIRIAGTWILLGAAGCVPSPRVFRATPELETHRIAILPLANYSSTREASEKLMPILAAEIGRRPGVSLVEPGAVEAALAQEPWLLFDRIPPDLLDRFGQELGADALLVGSVLGYGHRASAADQIPHVSLALRLLQTPGGRVLWSAVHSRDGEDGEWLFGFGRVADLDQLVEETVQEMIATLPPLGAGPGRTTITAVPTAGADSLAPPSDSARGVAAPTDSVPAVTAPPDSGRAQPDSAQARNEKGESQ
jgi:hypothetical protein